MDAGQRCSAAAAAAVAGIIAGDQGAAAVAAVAAGAVPLLTNLITVVRSVKRCCARRLLLQTSKPAELHERLARLLCYGNGSCAET